MNVVNIKKRKIKEKKVLDKFGKVWYNTQCTERMNHYA